MLHSRLSVLAIIAFALTAAPCVSDAADDTSYQRIMSHLLQTYSFLLVGYGVNDPYDLDLVFALTTAAFGAALWA